MIYVFDCLSAQIPKSLHNISTKQHPYDWSVNGTKGDNTITSIFVEE